MKRRYRILIAAGVCVLLIAAGTSMLLETQAGLQWTVHLIERHSGGAVRIGAANGRLAGPFTLNDVHLTLPGADIDIKHLELDWQPSDLLFGQLRIGKLEGSGIRIHPRRSAKRSSKTSAPVLPRRLGLPLHIHVTSARLSDLAWDRQDETWRLDRLVFSLDAGNSRVRISRLGAHGPGIDVTGTVRVVPRGRWPVHVDASIELRSGRYPGVVGRTRLDGELRGTVRLRETVSKPFQAKLDARLDHLFGTPQVRGTLHVTQLDPHQLDATWPALNAGARLAFAGQLSHFKMHGRLSEDGIRGKHRVALDLEGGVRRKRLQLDHLNVALAGSPARLTLRGWLGLQAPHSANLTVAWQALQWPLKAARPVVTAGTGGAHLHGTPDNWSLELRTVLRAQRLPQGRWAFTLHGDRTQMTLTALAGSWLGGSIAGSGHLRFTGKHPLELNLHARALDPGQLDARVAGRAGFDAAVKGNLVPLSGTLRVTRLQGYLHGHALQGQAELAYAGQVLDLKSLRLAAGNNNVKANGRWGPTLKLEWQLQAPRLGELDPRLQGQLTGHGAISGTPKAPRIKAELQTAGLHLGNLRLAQARLQGDIVLGTHLGGSVSLHLKHLQRGALELERLDATLRGLAGRQTFALAATGNQGRLELSGTGRLTGDQWRGELVSGRLQPLKSPAFTLDAPATLRLSSRASDLARNCWHDDRHHGFCLSARSTRGTWKAELSLESLPLALADAYLGDSVELRGTTDGSIRAHGTRQGFDAVSEIHVGAGSVTRNVAGKPQRFEFREAGLETRLDPQNAETHIGLILPGGGALDATLAVPWRKNTKPTGHLHLVAHLPDLSGLGALTPAVGDVGGRLDANLDIRGSLEAPRFQGHLQLAELRARLTRFGTRITRGELRLQGSGSGVRITGQVHDAKNGTLHVEGTLQRASNWRLDAKIKGSHFHASNMPEAKVAVSPDLAVSVRGHVVTLNGSVTVPTAEIRPPHFSGAIAPSPDLVIVGGNGKRALPWTLVTTLHIRLGDHVRFQGYGLSARIGGELTLHDQPRKLTTAAGELKILDGEYKAYGQDLTIEHGRLLFSGGQVANPGLDIRAIRKVGSVTAGLQVNGTLRSPRLQVFSDPPMTQTNALAYLLFGHGMEQTTGSEQSTVNHAANALGIAGGTFLVKAIGKQVGVDTVSVENASPYEVNARQASLFLGKYLSPRLYVSYGIGIYEPINLLRIRYTLSRRWALEAESGTFSGADILFTIGQ